MINESLLCVSQISPDGRRCVSGQFGSRDKPGKPAPMIVWDIPHRKMLYELHGLAGRVVSLDTSTDSRFVVASGENCMLVVFDCSDGEMVYSRRTEGVCALCRFEPMKEADEYLFVTCFESTCFVNRMTFDLVVMGFSVSTTKMAGTTVHRKPVDGAVIDSNFFMVSTTGDLLVYSLVSGSFRGSFSLGSESAYRILALDEEQCLVASTSGKILQVQLHNGSHQIAKCVYQGISIVDIALSQKNHLVYIMLVSGAMMTVDIASNEVAELGMKFFHSCPLLVVGGARSGNTVGLGTSKAEVLISDSSSLVPGLTLSHNKGERVTSMHATGDLFLVGYAAGQVRQYGKSGVLLLDIPSAHRGCVTALAGNDMYVATAGMDGSVRVWKHTRHVTEFPCGRVGGILINDDKIYFWTDMRELMMISVKLNRIVKKFTANKYGNVVGFTFATYKELDQVIVSAHWDGSVVVWDFDYDLPVVVFTVGDSCLTCITSVSDNKVLCGTRSGGVVTVNIDSGSIWTGTNEVCQKPLVSVCCTSADTIVAVNEEGLVMNLSLPVSVAVNVEN